MKTDGVLNLEVGRQRASRVGQRRRNDPNPGGKSGRGLVCDNLHRDDIGDDAVEGRVDALDPLSDGWVGGEEELHEAARRGEEEVLRLEVRIRAGALGARHPTHLLQSRSQPKRIARKLHRRGVGEVFALPRNRGLNDLSEEDAARADEQHGETRHDQRGGQRKRILIAIRRLRTDAHEDITELGQGRQSGHRTDDADADRHIAVTDVAEFVGDHTLQLLARQIDQRPAGHPDGGVLWVIPRGECVDGAIAVDDIAQRDRQTGREGNFLHDIEVAAFGEVDRARNDQTATQALGDGPAALGQLGDTK